MKNLQLFLFSVFVISLSACSSGTSTGQQVKAGSMKVPSKTTRSKSGNPTSYVVFGKRYYVMDDAQGFKQKGIASWYGKKFHGRKTSSGEVYNMHAMTAAHKSLPLPSYVRVVNLLNGKEVIVKVNDRGPFVGDRIIDLSYAAATRIDMTGPGVANVEITVLSTSESNKQGGAKSASLGQESAKDIPIFVQIGSFSSKYNARNLKQDLHAANEKSVVISNIRTAQGTFYRVRIGPLYDIRKANSVVRRMKNKGYSQAKVVVLK